MFRRQTFLAALFFAATALPALAGQSSFDRTLPTGAHPMLTLSTNSGYIHVHPGADSQIHIVAHLHRNNHLFSGDVEQRMDQISRNPPIQQSGNSITVGERQNTDLYRDITIDYDVAAPKGVLLDLASGSGDVELQEVGARVKASSGSGSVRARRVHGDADLQSGSGDVELTETAAGDVRAQTGSGSIRLHDIDGGVRAHTGSGDIEVTGRIRSEWRLDTGSGSIRCDPGQGARFHLNADTGSGTVRGAPSIHVSGESTRNRMNGDVNGGGPPLHAETASGDIEIR